MKLFMYTHIFLIIIIINVECGLVKDFFGTVVNKVDKVKEDVHTILGQTVNAISKEKHKLHQGLSTFLHKKEHNENESSGSELEDKFTTVAPHLSSSTELVDNNKNIIGQNTNSSNDLTMDHKLEENIKENELSNEQSTIVSEHKEDIQVTKHIQDTKSTESNNATNDAEMSNFHENTIVKTTTTEFVTWNNNVRLENILPTIMYNDSHIKNDNIFATNTENISGTNQNDIGLEDARRNETKNEQQNSNKTRGEEKFDSDQIIFEDNRNALESLNNKLCPSGLVKAANGDCLEQTHIELRKIHKANIFGVNCPHGQARAIDGSCQKIIVQDT